MLGVDAEDFAQFKRWSDARSQIFNTACTPNSRRAFEILPERAICLSEKAKGVVLELHRSGLCETWTSPLEGTGSEPSVPLRRKCVANRRRRHERWSHLRV